MTARSSAAPCRLLQLILLLTTLGGCAGVDPGRDSYLDYIRVDERPPMVTSPVGADSLWGPRTEDTRGDGIADSRRAKLEELVGRFAPTLVLPVKDCIRRGKEVYRLFPTNAGLYADTLSLDLIRIAPYGMNSGAEIPFHELTSDSLVRLMDSAVQYWADPWLAQTWYFDFPGRKPREWWRAYAGLRTGPDASRWARPTVYAHPFPDALGRTILQYWYFYPFNDHMSNHEGDWEHVNVVLSKDLAKIEEVHYFFHHRSVELPQGKYEPKIIDGTHPLIYVGGRAYNVLDYPMRLLSGDRNEGSHGCYPYPGEWEAAAGLGSPESVRDVDDDSTRVLPYSAFDIILTPEPSRIDYHRVPDVLQEWAWLILPVRWGYPTAPSLGAAIKFAEVGNTAPFGPAFNAGWDRTAHGLLYPAYQVHRVPRLRSYAEDLLQPWYYMYLFRSPRYVNDPRGLMDRRTLEKLGLAPRGGWREVGVGTTALGLHIGRPLGDGSDAYEPSTGFLLWRSLWGKVRFGAVEALGGYQKFTLRPSPEGSLFVYPLILEVVVRAPDARLRPYVALGGGAYGWEFRERLPGDLGTRVRSGWDAGWTTAAGVEYYLRPRVALDVSLRFHETGISGSKIESEKDSFRFLAIWVGHFVRF